MEKKKAYPNRDMLARHMAKETDITITESRYWVDSVIESLTEVLMDEGVIHLRDFGDFNIREIPRRNAVNPATKEPMVIEKMNTVKFKPKKHLKDLVNGRV